MRDRARNPTSESDSWENGRTKFTHAFLDDPARDSCSVRRNLDEGDDEEESGIGSNSPDQDRLEIDGCSSRRDEILVTIVD